MSASSLVDDFQAVQEFAHAGFAQRVHPRDALLDAGLRPTVAIMTVQDGAMMHHLLHVLLGDLLVQRGKKLACVLVLMQRVSQPVRVAGSE